MHAFVGCRTTQERNARGEGIGVYYVDAAGAWKLEQVVETDPNPSFLAVHPTLPMLYSVHGDLDRVSAFRIAPDGRLSFAGQQGTGGRNPVHLEFDPLARWLVVPNYKTDSVAVLPVEPDGQLGPLSSVLPLEGTLGPHRTEQDYGRPHHAPRTPDGRFYVVPAKGLDRLFTLRLDESSGTLSVAVPPVAARETSGPRHVAFGWQRAYVINELDSTLAVYDLDAGTGALTPRQVRSALPEDFTGDSRGSEILVSPRHKLVHASNRGHDSIVTFRVEPNGLISEPSWVSTGGSTPRFFALDPEERFLYAANEDSDTIVQFAVDEQTGRLSPTGRSVATGSPTCIVFRQD